MIFFARIVSCLNLLAIAFIFIALGLVTLILTKLSLPAFPSIISPKDIHILLISFLISFVQLLYLHLIIKNFNKPKDKPFSNNRFKNILFLIVFIILNIYIFNVVCLSTGIILKAYKYCIKSFNILFLAYGFYLLEKIFCLLVITINIFFAFLTLLKTYFPNHLKKAFVVSFLLMSMIPFYFFGFSYYKNYQYHKKFPSYEETIITNFEKIIFNPPAHYIYVYLDSPEIWPFYKDKGIELNYSKKLILIPPSGYIPIQLNSIQLRKILNQSVSHKQIVAIYAKSEKQYKKIIENLEDDLLLCTYDCLDGLAIIYKNYDMKKHYYSFDKTLAKHLNISANNSETQNNMFYSETLFYETIAHHNYSYAENIKISGTALTMTGEVLLLNQRYFIVNHFSYKNKYDGDYKEYHDFNKRWLKDLTAINPSSESEDKEYKYIFKLKPNNSDNSKN